MRKIEKVNQKRELISTSDLERDFDFDSVRIDINDTIRTKRTNKRIEKKKNENERTRLGHRKFHNTDFVDDGDDDGDD